MGMKKPQAFLLVARRGKGVGFSLKVVQGFGGIALRKAYKKYKIKHAISFHRSIQAASNFSDLHASPNKIKRVRPRVKSFQRKRGRHKLLGLICRQITLCLPPDHAHSQSVYRFFSTGRLDFANERLRTREREGI